MSRITGIRLKIERAKKHIRDLNADWQTFRETDPYRIRVDHDPQTGERVFRIDFRHQVPPEFSLIIGDAIHNLRSALDHLAWQLVEANNGTPTFKTAYPIRESPEKYESVDPAIVRGIALAPLQLIEATQPYQSGYGDLGRLHELDIFDKHRLLVVASFQCVNLVTLLSDGFIESFQMTPLPPGVPTGPRILQDGHEIGRANPLTGPFDMQIDFELSYEVAFVQPPVVYGEPVLPFMTQLTQLVEGVVNSFVRFL